MAFCNCKDLEEVALNDSIEEIGDMCFWGTKVDTSQIKLKVPQSAEWLGLAQKGVRELVLPEGLETVTQYCFENSEVEKVVIPSSVRELGSYAFAECNKLGSVVFQDVPGLESIGTCCFTMC